MGFLDFTASSITPIGRVVENQPQEVVNHDQVGDFTSGCNVGPAGGSTPIGVEIPARFYEGQAETVKSLSSPSPFRRFPRL